MQPSSEPTSTAPGLEKRGANEAIGRSRGGSTTKIHTIVDALGNPLAVSLTEENVRAVEERERQLLARKAELEEEGRGWPSPGGADAA